MFDEMSKHMPFVYKIAFANRWLFGGVIDSMKLNNVTTAPTMLSASVKSNVLPIEAIALVNFRIHPQNSVEDVFDLGLVSDNVFFLSWQIEMGFNKVIESSVGDVIVVPGLMIWIYGKVDSLDLTLFLYRIWFMELMN